MESIQEIVQRKLNDAKAIIRQDVKNAKKQDTRIYNVATWLSALYCVPLDSLNLK
jgi:hypothetical protein